LLRMLAFRPAAVIDDSISPGDLREVGDSGQPGDAALEVGTPVKKSREVRQRRALQPQHADEGPGVSPETPEPAPAPAVGTALSSDPLTGAGNSPPLSPAGDFALADLTPHSWPLLLERLGLVGIVYNIASHCELRSSADGNLQLVLDAGNASLFNDGHSEKIRLALENYFSCPLSLSIVPGEVGGETPAMRKARLVQERQLEAIAAIEGDPVLQKLIARFDGELDRSSITPKDF